MRYVDSDEFTPLDDKHALLGEPLVVHRRQRVPSHNLLVFAHGLGGARYGTWGNFPRFLFEDLEQAGVDIGLYSYRTLLGRLRFTASIELDREAAILADVIRELPDRYRRVVLIAHSMGGLLAKAAVKSLIDRDERAAVDRIAGLILMATPQAGSLAIPSFLARFSRDARALEPHGRLVTSIVETFTDRVGQEGISGTGRFVIPTWAVVAPEDLWVDRLSAGLQIPSKRRKEVHGSHTSIVKPAHRDADAYQFVLRAIAECFAGGEARTTQEPTPRPRRRSGAVEAGSLRPTVPMPQIPFDAFQPGSSSPINSPRADFGVPAELLMTQSPAGLVQAVQAKPRVDELFEIIIDPDEVPKALFGTERATGVAPYEVDYVNARDGVPDVRDALEAALRDTGGRLLVCGREGIGKTREIAELARAACAKNWKILVPRRDGDSRLGPLFTLTPELADARVLVVVDNLHNRMLNGADERVPYVDRLEQFLAGLERHLPHDVRVLASARDEPHFQRQLGLPAESEPWRGFGLFRLPELTGEGLQRILTTCAARAGVALEVDDVAKLVENSDRKAETLFINVDLARRSGTALTISAWLPTEGESWRHRFAIAGARHAGVESVCRALRLLVDAGLPARIPYVAAVAGESGADNAHGVIDTLVLDGLLGLRQGTLAPFSAEQLDELLGERTASDATIVDYAKTLEKAITDPAARPTEWTADLLALAESLARSDNADQAEQVATRAIELGARASRAYRIRIAIRFGRLRLAEAEDDLTAALAIDPDEKDLYFVRAATRNLLAKFTGALEDIDLAVQHGREDDAAIHSLRGAAYYQLGRWPEAEPELTAAIERGDTSGTTYFVRGLLRHSANDYGAAEEDFTTALEHGLGLDQVVKQLRAIEAGTSALGSLAAEAEVPPTSSSAFMLYALRGITRLSLGKAALAEQDLSEALKLGFGENFRSFADTLTSSRLPTLARAREQLSAAPVPIGDGIILAARGRARLILDRAADAEADFDAALAAGYNGLDVFFGRGCARVRLDKLVEAEQDASVIVDQGKADAATFSLRGVARLGLKKAAEAETDFDEAIALGRDDAVGFAWRAAARTLQQKLQEADQDLSTAIERDSSNAEILFRRGSVRCDLGRFAEAEADLSAALTLGHEAAHLFLVRAVARVEQGRRSEADDDLNVIFARGDAGMQAYSLRGGLRLDQDRFDEAEEALTSAIALGRNDAWVRFNRGLARKARQRMAEAEEDFDAVVAMGVTDANVLFSRGQTRLSQQRFADAEADFRASHAAGLDDANVHYLLSLSLWDQKRYADAEGELDLALARVDDPDSRRSRGHLRLIRGNLNGAEGDFDAVIAGTPRDAEALRLRGSVRYAQGRNVEALSDFAAALDAAPDNASCLTSCVLTNLRLGRVRDAEAVLGKLRMIHPDMSDALGCDAVLHLAQGDVGRALTQLTAVAARDADWNCWRGLACLAAGRFDDARGAYEPCAAESEPGDILIAISDLEFEIRQRPGPTATAEGQAAVANIRQTLSGKLESAKGGELRIRDYQIITD